MHVINRYELHLNSLLSLFSMAYKSVEFINIEYYKLCIWSYVN